MGASSFLPLALFFVGMFVLLLGFWLIRTREQMKRRKGGNLRRKYSSHRDGILLQQELANHDEHDQARTKIFTFKELEMATNDFERLVDGGEHGSVYHGVLPDKTVVAVKELKSLNADRIVNEVIALSQINHRNVVRLLGCCLESRKPLLVYEYFSNIGTLYDHISYARGFSQFPLELRMKIAVETAAALAYMHSSISKPVIIHQNVKATNILLDKNYMVKLSDSGFSRTKMKKDLGYLDPECLRSNNLTEKSDVYSFGVVLVTMLTSRRAASPHRPQAERNLANVFARAMEGQEMDEILDYEIINEGNIELVKKVADLALRCIRARGAERPSMKEVAMELEGLRIMAKHPRGGGSSSCTIVQTPNLVPASDAFVVHVRGDGFDRASRSSLQEVYLT